MPRSSRDEEFSAFVQTRRTGLVRSACLLTAGDTYLGEDLLQTALARLHVAWPKVRRGGTESAYVWRMVVNAHVDEVRRPADGESVRYPNSPRHPHHRGLPERPGRPEVCSAFAALLPGMCAAVVLRHWLDLSVEETAELMNCSEGTSRARRRGYRTPDGGSRPVVR